MKSAVGWVVVLLVMAGGAGGGFYTFDQMNRERAYEKELAALKRQFLVNTQSLYAVNEETYRQEIGPHLSTYFKGLDKLAKTYPELYDIEREKKKGEADLAADKMSKDQKDLRDERIAITLDLFNRMMQGQYRPLYTQSAMNFRFDIYDISPAQVEGQPQVKFAYVHWGPYPEDFKPGVGPVSYKSILGNIRAEQEEGKPVEVPQIVGEAQPPSLQISPEHWIAEFPPGIEVGYYDLPQFPPKATAIQLSFTFGIRTIGGSELIAPVQFAEMPIPDAWKVAEGQAWEGEERTATDDELQAAGAKPTP